MSKSESQIKKSLSGFLKNNPDASLDKVGNNFLIKNPWGDNTLYFELPNDIKKVRFLNNLYLPPRLIAIFHTKRAELEVIFTALPTDPDFYKRSFKLHLVKETYFCQFANSSKELLSLANIFRQSTSPSQTSYRNLESYQSYLRQRVKGTRKLNVKFRPISFWIKGFKKWDEKKILEKIKELSYIKNFIINTPAAGAKVIGKHLF